MDYCLKRESSNNQKTIIFGSDIPTLDHVLLENAIKSLSEYDVVFGAIFRWRLLFTRYEII